MIMAKLFEIAFRLSFIAITQNGTELSEPSWFYSADRSIKWLKFVSFVSFWVISCNPVRLCENSCDFNRYFLRLCDILFDC